MYEQLLSLDALRLNFSAAGMKTINIVLALVMFGVALDIRPGRFVKVFQQPKSVILGLCSQWILLPAMTFGLIVLLRHQIPPMVAMGMLLVASCPGGNISNFLSSLSKANTELSVSLTAVSTTCAIFVTPFNFAFWGGLYVKFLHKAGELALPSLHIDLWETFQTVFILLGIPIVLGMLCSRYLPRLSARLKKPMQVFSLIFFVLMVVLAFGNNLRLFLDYIFYIFFIVLAHNALALGIGYSMGSIFRLPIPDRRTLTIETGIQNSGLGLVLLFNPGIFPPDLALGGMLFVTAWWGVWHIVSGLTVAGLFRWRSRPHAKASQCA